MIADATMTSRPPRETQGRLAGSPPLIAPDAWIDSRADFPAERLARLREALSGQRSSKSLDLRPDPLRPGIYGATLDGWAFWLIVYPGGHGVRVLAAAPISPIAGV